MPQHYLINEKDLLCRYDHLLIFLVRTSGSYLADIRRFAHINETSHFTYDLLPKSTNSIKWIILSIYIYTVLSESISTKYARVLWQISFVYSQAENNDFYAAVCQSQP